MTLEYLKQIREKEALADRIRQDGVLESKKTLIAANDEAAAIIDNAQSEADELYRETIARAEKDAQLDFEKVIVNAEQECELFLEGAERHKSQAVSLIVKRVLG